MALEFFTQWHFDSTIHDICNQIKSFQLDSSTAHTRKHQKTYFLPSSCVLIAKQIPSVNAITSSYKKVL